MSCGLKNLFELLGSFRPEVGFKCWCVVSKLYFLSSRSIDSFTLLVEYHIGNILRLPSEQG
ncbi:unnamed protein product [Schistosoma margrebowiei]|uniref:Uncharacterized protein n=1 Tax=Schistosoma margrebowiei TaxID=48269 RepID=A0A3P8AAT4_9TREM|nr:unnamed protein product [Schistosoma margrebowiei]